ncbi:hypothetical protein D9613_004003 [Agrocybe pediades]|uniref:pyranose dehydrogenase (acceptor) n=1 Tax=Agrocybe pediades TaxID=84607 RepID=A0A8H4VJB8_9AGAR|nr:hypothetical protein D9613_004003 [Agrocybe pediades]
MAARLIISYFCLDIALDCIKDCWGVSRKLQHGPKDLDSLLRGNCISRTEYWAGEFMRADGCLANGVEFLYQGNTYTVNVHKEVILSAGSIKSPHILELSGIGRPEILRDIGVPVLIELPGLGENSQDHLATTVVYELNPTAGHETVDLLNDPEYAATAKLLYAQGKGPYRTGSSTAAFIKNSIVDASKADIHISNVEQEILQHKLSGNLPPGLLEQYELQLPALKDEENPDGELFLFPGHYSLRNQPAVGKIYLTLVPILNHPMFRGTAHSKSSNRTEPLASDLGKEIEPGEAVQSDADIEDFIKQHPFSAYHTVGTCSMLPLEKQGVVDHNLKVHGTENLRVVDVSIIPLHIAAHTQATAYSIGEKAADIIKSEM